MATLAGCTGGSDDPDTSPPEDDPGVADDDSDYGSWPMIHYNAANRLSVPHDGLDGEPEILWTAELEGTVSPPVVYDDVAYVSHGSGFYTALDLTERGDTVWEHETGERGTPAVSDAAVFVAGDGVEALDHDDGDVLWNTGHDESVESLRIYDDLLYAGLEDRVIVLDETGEERLEIDVTETVQSLAVDDERVYVRSRPDLDEDDFVIAAYDLDTGDSIWEHEIFHAQQWFDDRLTKTFPLVDGLVYTVDRESLISINGESGELQTVAEFEQSSWNRPTIHDDCAYIRIDELVAYDFNQGRKSPTWDPEINTTYPVVVAGDSVYTIRSTSFSAPPDITSVEYETGAVNWEAQPPELDEAHFPVVLNELILLSIDDPGIVAFG
ncbi:PQQ-binding-like beta-propeller repeat protein [Natronobeatus ordinarius]|uniref:outer membrane protein assembly factor BamB family protein n=1 Tax=Natronobeatus ordinarius TaxID=2963433 RepID=UPI0020CB7BD2|nr:PQQ-binding-like beta-propeller repeat protein [Natronobeatus ordinarius]